MPQNTVKFQESELLVEVDPPVAVGNGMVPVASASGLIFEAAENIECAMSRVTPAAKAIINSLNEINNISEAQIEFSIKFGVDGNIIIAKGNVEGNFRVTVTWKNTQ